MQNEDSPQRDTPRFDIHPDALGQAATADSDFVTDNGSKHLVITRVLLDQGTALVSELPRSREGRPTVYCPFCGRPGQYKKRQTSDRFIEHFAHDGHADCVQGDLDNALHTRAIEALVAWLQEQRERNRPVSAELPCRRCKKLHHRQLVPPGAWDEEAIEQRVTTADGYRVPDVHLRKNGEPVFFFEVAHSSLVDGNRLRDLKDLGIGGVELLAEPTVALDASVRRLGGSRQHWNLEFTPSPFLVCEQCRRPDPTLQSVARVLEKCQDPLRLQASRAALAELTGVPEQQVTPSMLYASVRTPESFRRWSEKLALQHAKQRAPDWDSVREVLRLALGWESWGPWERSSLSDLLSDPHQPIRSIWRDHRFKSSSAWRSLSKDYGTWVAMAEQLCQVSESSVKHLRVRSLAELELFETHAANGNTAAEVETLVYAICRRAHDLGHPEVRGLLRKLVRQNALMATRTPAGVPLLGLEFFAAEEVAATAVIERMLQGRVKQKGRNCPGHSEVVSLSESQRGAVDMAAQARVSVVTGGPGTGKTTLLRALIDKEPGLWLGLAPTWKAVSRMRGALSGCSSDVYTMTAARFVSKTMGELPDGAKNGRASRGWTRGFSVIVDEAGCLDSRTFGLLMKGASLAHRIVFLGDPNQLPSVGPGAVLRDLTEGGILPHVHLTEVHRSSEESGIPTLARSILCGQIDLSGPAVGLSVRARRDIAQEVERAYRNALTLGGPGNIQVLTPTNDLRKALNVRLQRSLNPSEPHLSGNTKVRIGDPVILRGRHGKLVKGDTARIVAVEGNQIVLEMGQGERQELPMKYSWLLNLAYCITVHKSQGSEWDRVIVAVAPCKYRGFLNRSLLYTAVTRAKKQVLIVGSREAIDSAIACSASAQRTTLLAGLIGARLRKG